MNFNFIKKNKKELISQLSNYRQSLDEMHSDA